MKSHVAHCAVMDATAIFLIALIASKKLYNIPPTKAVTNETLKPITIPQGTKSAPEESKKMVRCGCDKSSCKGFIC